MKRIQEIWQLLLSKAQTTSGLDKIRYSDGASADLYLGIKYPEMHRMLLLRIEKSHSKICHSRKSQGIKLEKIEDVTSRESVFLSLILTNDSLKDIFNTLISDIIELLNNDNDPAAILKKFKNRVEQWFFLFEKLTPEGLSSEQQRGLFGELYFLRKWLKASLHREVPIKAWLGPQAAARDFQVNNLAVEVKTTYSKNHQKIRISNELQLDPTHLSKLILFHLSLESQIENGETLNSIIKEIDTILIDEQAAMNEFRIRLFEYGYLSQHASLYSQTGYKIRKESFYEVRDDFPRIEEKNIPRGIGDLTYSIIITDQGKYLIDEQFVLKILSENDR